MLAVAVAVFVAAASPVGAWFLNGEPFATFKSDGTCSMTGEQCTWRVNGDTLFITGAGDTDAVPFHIDAGVLTLVVGGMPMQLSKTAGAAAAAPAMPEQPAAPARAAPAAPAAGRAAKIDPNDPLAKLLLSSAWCSFHYNQTSGASSTKRVQWFPDGSYQLGGRSEGYSSGAAGTFASQHDSGSTGHWAVSKGQLMATPPPSAQNPMPTEMVVVPLTITRNSNGYPIVTSYGEEYSQCQ